MPPPVPEPDPVAEPDVEAADRVHKTWFSRIRELARAAAGAGGLAHDAAGEACAVDAITFQAVIRHRATGVDPAARRRRRVTEGDGKELVGSRILDSEVHTIQLAGGASRIIGTPGGR